ncbi:hypothetical protein SEA_YABOI_264 [Streptomyces phage Yaboi]|jgi:hypothetical protein|uniref:Uncharacterized protein n=3 Tax=Streptomyces virus Yaboi TaxID=2846408 RepID=A0A411CG50_9CAUD|nr:hypothetical protein HWB86_gp003 [Streptomyces phage Yaboi]YP_009841355.1 hypothetical protein HWB86_gp063 [Streptomyces phage Yaboi]QAY08665.1 hypothetical protein SEA_GENIE2_3 [Streptomyces phage Genie2]QAY12655.1 hypothetical protein SEA_BOOMERJR_3 [Streptomyces phage BoomerJR]UVD39851.1 hypothetical protein SEA_STANIMAL_3 [Streptomyces phage Stanimal]WNM73592.1 hypothetical protein SEA_SOLLERTIA_3 [Streptomyces phage Sollertia]AYB70842.1 hypothetical protein SEA_YABOI_3 [Streptomyces p
MGYYALTQDRIVGHRRSVAFANSAKGIPIPGTGRRSCRCGFCSQNSSANGGVSASSRILPHRYADEGEKGPLLRREIRRKERAVWLAEAFEEMMEDYESESYWN